jgi:hypothetical protein
MSETTTTLTEGCIVTDRDTEDDDRLCVVSVYDDRADEWRIDAIDATVAECNPDYPAGDHVIACVYVEDAEDTLGEDAPGWRIRRSAAFGDLRTYTFPRSRLRRVTGGDQR